MKKGIVMDILSEREAIVLTKDGQFLKAVPAKADFRIGDEVIYSDNHQTFTNKQKFSPPVRWIASIAAVFLFFFIGLPGYFSLNFGSQEVVAYVSVDINPSVEFGINSKNKVISVTALNEDGDLLLTSINDKLLKKDLSKAIDYLFNESISRGYLNEDNEVIVSTTTLNHEIDTGQIEEKISEVINKPENESKAFTVTMIQTSSNFREEALKNGVSSGKYAVYVTVKNSGQNISVADIKKDSVTQWKQAIESIKKEKNNKSDLAKIIDQRLEKINKKSSKKVKDNLQNKKNNSEQSGQISNPEETNTQAEELEVGAKELKTDRSLEEKKFFLQIKKWSEAFQKHFKNKKSDISNKEQLKKNVNNNQGNKTNGKDNSNSSLKKETGNP